MKFSTHLLTILVATAAYAIPAADTNPDNSNVIVIKNDNGSSECDNSIKAYEECIQAPYKVTKDEKCNLYNSEKCQTYFNNDIKSIKGCENIPDLAYSSQNLVRLSSKTLLVMTCSKDEAGNYCPLSDISYNLVVGDGKEVSFDDEFKKDYIEAAKNTCKSKSCIDASLEYETVVNELKKAEDDYLEKIKPIMENINSDIQNKKFRRDLNLDSIVGNTLNDRIQIINLTNNYLKSEECSALKVETTNTTTSGSTTTPGSPVSVENSAATINYTVALMATLALFLINLA